MFKKHSLIITSFLLLVSTTVQADELQKKHFGYGETYASLQGGWGKAFSLGVAGKVMDDILNMQLFCLNWELV